MFESIIVELTSLCNMDCSFCPNSVMKREKKHMDYDLFVSIIDDIADKRLTETVELAAIGESLLHDRLFDAVAYCRERKLKTGLITNGILLTPERYRKLSKSGLTNLNISLHNLTEKAFFYRHPKGGIDFRSYYRNILDVIETHVSMDSPVNLSICLLFSRKNWISTELWDLDGIKEDTERHEQLLNGFVNDMAQIAARQGGVLRLSPKHISRLLKGLDVFRYQGVRAMKNVYISVVPLNPQPFNTRKKLEGEYGEKIELVKPDRGSCPYLDRPMVLSNGAFVPCCLEGLNELDMGRVDMTTSLYEVINGEKYQALMRGFKKGRIIHPVCRECRGTLRYRDTRRLLAYAADPERLYQRAASLYAGSKSFVINMVPARLKKYLKENMY